VYEINEDEMELPRFTIDGEIDSTAFQCRSTQLNARLLPPYERGFEPHVPFPSQCDGSV